MADENAIHYFSCRVCGQPHQFKMPPPNTVAYCVRCGSGLMRRRRGSLNKTAALTLAALLLYLPANLFPILRLELYGEVSDNTVWDGVVLFYRDGQWVMAAVVLLASIIIPVVKIIGLFALVITTQMRLTRGRLLRTWLYRVIDSIGRWAMLDVFVLAIWIAVLKLQRMGSVMPGSGLLPFGAVVVLSIMAASSFDPQLIWEDEKCG